MELSGISSKPGESRDKIDAISAFRYKLDLYLRTHVFSRFEPDDIRWVLSLSGGKDSYSMAVGLRDWYQEHNLPFTPFLFTIDQWHGAAAQTIRSQISWANVNLRDAYAMTGERTGYKPGDQAPCRSCADVRRSETDAFLSKLPPSTERTKATVVARGLHVTDTAISALWRFAMGRDPAEDLFQSGKARPFTSLGTTFYLAKPLYYIREHESQQFALAANYQSACCGCPACKYPSRRDIVEESLAYAIRGPRWEFDVPGIRRFLQLSASEHVSIEVERNSAEGIESKHPHIPSAFFEYATDLFRIRARDHPNLHHWFCRDSDYGTLDTLGLRRLQQHADPCNPVGVPIPAILFELGVSELQLRMIGTLGPCWGAIALAPKMASQAWDIQKQVFGVSIDSGWSQVNVLLRSYYSNARLVPRSLSEIRFLKFAFLLSAVL